MHQSWFLPLLVLSLSMQVFVAVITGRCIPDIRSKVSFSLLLILPGRYNLFTRSASRTSPTPATTGSTSGILTEQGRENKLSCSSSFMIDYFRFVPPMPEEVEEKASWLLQRLQAECCEVSYFLLIFRVIFRYLNFRAKIEPSNC